jgi:hypothetical protein
MSEIKQMMAVNIGSRALLLSLVIPSDQITTLSN